MFVHNIWQKVFQYLLIYIRPNTWKNNMYPFKTRENSNQYKLQILYSDYRVICTFISIYPFRGLIP